jgi:hypothetical protein
MPSASRIHPGALACVFVAGCFDMASPRGRYEFAVRVESDPGTPLAGAVLSHGGRKLAVTGASGSVRLAAEGKEGESVAFHVTCPDGHRSPPTPLAVLLRRLSEKNKRPEYEVSCPPKARTVVVAVRAERGANLPVRYLDRELGRTDASGAAHVVLQAEPESTVELSLDTSAAPALRPQNPSARFEIGARDEVFSFVQSFQVETPPAARSRARGPVRIGAR